MCGLFGIMGPGVIENDLKVLRELAQCSIVRGSDGAGMLQGAVYQKTSNFTVEKTGNEIAYLLWYHEKAKGGDRFLFNSTIDNFFCGHVRAATRGTINEANAHPFELDTLVGMHNGTLHHTDFKVLGGKTDSEVMFEQMEKDGIRSVLNSLHKESAYAIVVYDRKKKEFIFARNELRPLHCAWNSNRRVFYWASEAPMLEWILDRNGIKRSKIFSFTPNVIHRFAPLDVNSNKKPDWIIEDVKPKPVISITSIEANIPAQQKPHLRVVENKPSPLPQQQKAKEKDQKTTPPTREEKAKGRPVMARSKLHVDCISCGKDMDLLEQYTGNQLRANEYICRDCDLLYEQTGKIALLN